MSNEFLADRRRALEDSFFAKRDQELLEQLKKQMAADKWKTAVAEISGVTDESVVAELFPPQAGGETAAAMVLIPMVEVAWADGTVQSAERKAVLKAALQQGLPQKGPVYQLLEAWLHENPNRKLLATWKAYVSELSPTLSEPSKAALKESVIGRARAVAQAAGGFLGMGDKVSESEEEVLKELEEALK